MLAMAIASVEAQTFRDFEIVVVKDTDRRGVSYARNQGLERATGNYVAFLDDDDVFYPTHLERLVEVAERTGAGVVYSDANEGVQELQGSVWEVVRRHPHYSVPFRKTELLVRNFIPTPCLLIRRDLLETERFDEMLEVLEDWDLWIRLSERYDFVHVSETTAEYRTRHCPDRLSVGRLKAFLPAHKAIYDKYARRIAGRPDLAFRQAFLLFDLWLRSR